MLEKLNLKPYHASVTLKEAWLKQKLSVCYNLKLWSLILKFGILKCVFHRILIFPNGVRDFFLEYEAQNSVIFEVIQNPYIGLEAPINTQY